MHLPTIGIAPTPLSDPALWPYLAEPELFVLMATIGVRYTWMQLSLYWTMAMLRVRCALSGARSRS